MINPVASSSIFARPLTLAASLLSLLPLFALGQAPSFPSPFGVPGQGMNGGQQAAAQGASPTTSPTEPISSSPGPGSGSTSVPQRNSTTQANQRTDETVRAITRLPRLTDFQRLIEETTGQRVEIFGASLFENPPSTFAPVGDVPVTPNYVIGPGDEIRLQLWGQVNQQGDYVVDRSGAISIPQLGTIHVAGIAFSDLNSFLRAQFSRVYRNFELNANLGQLRSIQVFVVGQANSPGAYTISSLSTLLNALFASGGPSPQGSLRNIEVLRGSQTVAHFDLYDLLLRGDKSHDIPLLPGDVLFIPPAGPQVALLGSVNNPAIYELRGETSLGSLLTLTGGESNLAFTAQLRLERIFEHELRSIDSVSETGLASTTLRNGDIVTVTSIIDRFRNAVTLRGNVANPGRYPWHAGMRVTDLLPNKDALITRDYWQRRNQLGLPPPLFSSKPAEPTTEGRRAGANEGSLQVSSTGASSVSSPAAGTGASSSGAAAKPTQSGSASGGGNSVAAALASTGGPFAARTDVVLSAPDIDWTYAVIERQSATDLKTSLIPFNLGGAVLNHNLGDDPELLPNDVVTIFSTADIRVPISEQTRFVRLEGEFKASGVYSVKPGETLRQLVARAGGLTTDAYLYASQFTRLSTQRVERQRLDDYADQLEAQVSAVSARNSARALNDADAAASNAATSAARAAIGRLRQLQPIGRIVLQLKPDSEGVAALPDLPLEDGDRFIVPRISSNVYVEGQVYSANAFLFEPGRRTSRYLKLAGGPDREADKSRAFILRADGSVLSRQYSDVSHALIYPGDTIVVPPSISKRALLRDLVDVSSIIGQFGIGVAAINVLK